MAKNGFPKALQSLVDTLGTGSRYLGVCLLINTGCVLRVAMEAAQKARPEKEKVHKLRSVRIVRKRRNRAMKQTVFLTLINSKNSPRFNSPLNCVPW